MRRLLLTALLAMLLMPAASALAQVEDAEGGDVAASSSAAESTTPFTIIFLGTRVAGDVDVIRKNVARLPSVRVLVPLMESQMHVEYFGALAGSEEGLVADIRSLAADRFDVESRNVRNQGLVITLKKMAAPAPAAQ